MRASGLLHSVDLSPLLVLSGVFVAAVVYVIWLALDSAERRRPPAGKKWVLPPGPKGHLILGNLKEVRGGRESVR